MGKVLNSRAWLGISLTPCVTWCIKSERMSDANRSDWHACAITIFMIDSEIMHVGSHTLIGEKRSQHRFHIGSFFFWVESLCLHRAAKQVNIKFYLPQGNHQTAPLLLLIVCCC